MPGGAMISICGGSTRDLDLDFLVVELALAQHLAEFLARRPNRSGFMSSKFTSRAGGSSTSSRRSSAASAARSRTLRVSASRVCLIADFDQVADDRVDVAADVADLGELGRLDLDERRIGEPREPARDLGLADAGRADHQDVLRRDLLPQRLGDLLAPPAIAQRDRDGALGGVLADDVLVELGDDFLRGHATTWRRLARRKDETAAPIEAAAHFTVSRRPIRTRRVARIWPPLAIGHRLRQLRSPRSRGKLRLRL